MEHQCANRLKYPKRYCETNVCEQIDRWSVTGNGLPPQAEAPVAYDGDPALARTAVEQTRMET